jgi:1-phosphofructokinase family hexose kinase
MVTTLSTGGGGGGAAARLFVAGPNLAIDRTASLPVLQPGDVLRTREVAVTPGGKGVNVVRAARALGVDAGLAGFLPGRLGAVAAAMLREEGTRLRGVATGGELRSTSVLREDDGRVTVLNEPGPPVTAQDWDALERAVDEELRAGAAVLVCSGSVPPGAPADGFARLVALARAAAVPVLVDAKGPLLGAALAAGPDVVKPNLAEAEGLLGGDDREGVDVDPAEARARAEAACRGLRAAGARVAVVTAAAAGAAVAAPEGVRWFAAPAVTVANPIGAGDAFAAGYAVALARGHDALASTRAAVAAASAAVEHPLAGALDPARAAELEHALRPAP